MRIRVTLDPDVAAEVERLRRREGIGPSEAINRLGRRAIASRTDRHIYQPQSADLGLSADVSNIGEVLDLFDGAR